MPVLWLLNHFGSSDTNLIPEIEYRATLTFYYSGFCVADFCVVILKYMARSQAQFGGHFPGAPVGPYPPTNQMLAPGQMMAAAQFGIQIDPAYHLHLMASSSEYQDQYGRWLMAEQQQRYI